MFVGAGTLINVVAIIIGTAIGLAAGSRLPDRVSDRAVQAIGAFTAALGVASSAAMFEAQLTEALGRGIGVVAVLASVLAGSMLGAGWRLHDRLESLAERFTHGSGSPTSAGAGLLTASVLFCAGPMTVLGAMRDGLGQGIELLLVKSVLDGVSSVAFAATFGTIIFATAGVVIVIQGALTLIGFAAGSVLPDAAVVALDATGGIVLIALGLRLLGNERLLVADFLPALVIAPAVVAALAAILA